MNVYNIIIYKQYMCEFSSIFAFQFNSLLNHCLYVLAHYVNIMHHICTVCARIKQNVFPLFRVLILSLFLSMQQKQCFERLFFPNV